MANINKIRLSGQTYDIEDSGAQRTLSAGQGITIENNVISATGGGGSSYTAGDGIDITNDVISVTGKVDTSTYNTYTAATATAIGDKLATSDFNTYSGTVDTAINSKASQSDLSTLSGTVTAHTANTDIHVTTAQTAAWNAKSDFSGDYNDLANKPTIPTVPTSNTAFTNDAGYITSSALDGYATTGDVQTATNDMATKTWVGNQGYLTEHQSLSNYYTKSETSGATEINTALGNKQDTLVSGSNIKTINNESILGEGNITIEGGGGKAINAGRGISITTGETADTINCTLPITADTNTKAPKIKIDSDYSLLTSNSSVSPYNITKAHSNILFGNNNKVFNTSGSGGELSWNFLLGQQNSAQGVGVYKPTSAYNMFCGVGNTTQNSYGFASGNYNTLSKGHQFVVGDYHAPKNDYETNFGKYSISVSASTSFGNSGNTLFSIANGYNTANTHNAIEIRQNGDIYIADTNDTSTTNYYQKPMIKLQDALGGTVDTEITSASTNPVTSAAIYNQFSGLKLVKLTQSAYDALATKDSNTLYIING